MPRGPGRDLEKVGARVALRGRPGLGGSKLLWPRVLGPPESHKEEPPPLGTASPPVVPEGAQEGVPGRAPAAEAATLLATPLILFRQEARGHTGWPRLPVHSHVSPHQSELHSGGRGPLKASRGFLHFPQDSLTGPQVGSVRSRAPQQHCSPGPATVAVPSSSSSFRGWSGHEDGLLGQELRVGTILSSFMSVLIPADGSWKLWKFLGCGNCV